MNFRRCLALTLLVGLVLSFGRGALRVRADATSASAPSHAVIGAAAQGSTLQDTSWWAAVQDQVRQSEYQIAWQDETYLPDISAAYQAPNRAHNLRTYFVADSQPAGIRIIPRTGKSPAWEWGLSLSGIGDSSDLRPVGHADMVTSGNRVEYHRTLASGASAPLVEWYINDERGLEQGFTLASPPTSRAGDLLAEIVLELALNGDLTPNLVEDGAAIEFVTLDGVCVLRYSDLYAYDATGRSLPARLELASAHSSARAGGELNPSYVIRIIVDSSAAVYPIVVDPLVISPSWTREGNQADAWLGYSVGTAGDVNGDGYSDLVVGAPRYDAGQEREGCVFVYHGSASGLSTTAAWTGESNQAGAWFGHSTGTAGDVNGDGYADLVVGAVYYDGGRTDEGRVYVFHGSASGLMADAAWTAESNQAHGRFGWSVGTAGDINGDGYSDLVVGAPFYDAGQEDEGRTYVYYGSASGLLSAAAWIKESNQAYAHYGRSVGTAGDVNGDGYSDLVVGAPFYDAGQENEGRAYVYHGTASGLSTGASWVTEGNQAHASFAWSVGTAGDVDGDGYADLVVGANGYDADLEDEGQAYIYRGSASGLGTAASWTGEGDQAGAWFGHSVGTAGDVNGDGYADVIVGASTYDLDQTDEGCVYVYYGSSSGLRADASWIAEGNQAQTMFGRSASTAGDVNGDGYADLIVGAHNYDGGQDNEGRVYVYRGSASGLSTKAVWTATSDQTWSGFGHSVGAAGDVNGDGYADLIVGAPRYDAGQENEGRVYVYYGSASGLNTSANWMVEGNQTNAYFGASVGTAGDVNGDGYADLVVGAPYYDGGQEDEGRAYVYQGSAFGPSTTAAWIAESNQSDAHFGRSVGTAGDVNGDGYTDLVVSAPHYDAGNYYEGRAYVYHGSAFGLHPSAAWSTVPNELAEAFGYSVGTAGDVNGDGYSDLVIGAPNYHGETEYQGRAYVYCGSASGLSASATWTFESRQTLTCFGGSVGTAGDVNGDGYADLVVGAPGYIEYGRPGQAYVYHGSASGLQPTAAWSFESTLWEDRFGASVGTAGDINGDGYADIVIGASGYGRRENYQGHAYVYYGSASGLNMSTDWVAESNQINAGFGHSVGTVGDVNGDGYADLVVGAPGYDGEPMEHGPVTVYYGNEGAGLSLNPRQRRSDDSAPIAPLGRSADNAFRLKALGRTPFGRGKIRLEWEVKPLGDPFDGQDTDQSATWIDTGRAGRELTALVSNLSADTPYHWRVRLHYHPATTPFQQYSRWLTVPWNGWAEQDLRTGDRLPLVGFERQTYRVSEAVGAAAIRVTLDQPSGGSVEVDLQSSGGSAQAPGDYTAVNKTVLFPPGITVRTINVLIVDDGVNEENETIILSLSNASNADIDSTRNSTTLTIEDNDVPSLPQVGFGSATYYVDEGEGLATINLTLDQPSIESVEVDLRTSDGSAQAPGDYTAVDKTVLFLPGITVRTINVPIIDDGMDEENETIILSLSNASNADVDSTRNSATLTIEDNDVPPLPQVGFDSETYYVDESEGVTTIILTLDQPSSESVEVDLRTGDGSAQAPGDYAAVVETLVFPPGKTLKTLNIPIVDDEQEENDETVTLTLSNANNAEVDSLRNPATLVILDNDVVRPPKVGFSSPTYHVGEGQGVAAISVTLDRPFGDVVQVDCVTQDGTAKAPDDYAVVYKTLTFPPGSTIQTCEVSIVDDQEQEHDETIELGLSNAKNAVLNDACRLAALTIQDNDLRSVVFVYLPLVHSYWTGYLAH